MDDNKSIIDSHVKHIVSAGDYVNCQFGQKLSEEDINFVMKLDEARTDPRNIADVLSDRTGISFTCKDIKNLIAKMQLVARKPSSEELLSVIIENGGEVKYTKTKNSNDVQVLWLQTKEMKDSLAC